VRKALGIASRVLDRQLEQQARAGLLLGGWQILTFNGHR
jgi:hypothetical protein